MTSEPDEQALEAEAARVIAKYDLQPEDVNDEARRAAWKAAHPSDLGPMATEGRKQEFAEVEQAALQEHAERVAESWGYVVGEDGAVEPVGEHAFVPLSDRCDGSRNEATSRPVPKAQRETFTPIGREARRKAERAARRGR